MNSILGMVFCHRRGIGPSIIPPTLIAWSGSDVAVTTPSSVNPEPERMVENKRLRGPNLVDEGEESWEREATEREKRWRWGKIERATSVRGETRTKSQRMRRRHQEATERGKPRKGNSNEFDANTKSFLLAQLKISLKKCLKHCNSAN